MSTVLLGFNECNFNKTLSVDFVFLSESLSSNSRYGITMIRTCSNNVT